MKLYLSSFCAVTAFGKGGQLGEILYDLWDDTCSIFNIKVGKGVGGTRIRTKMASPHSTAAIMKGGVFSSFLES